ncbi:MAG: hypothetical protein DCF15_19965 [Phormidesmis priestleyi]|uniref:Uncharacterized protein n=1 Tax=Phormidesmis priestleyi TaxID=268141 RepID=A0A2W4WQ82_9CYAN|nr:MAG: hypothetical protein DCF15_19965 [Phormidesmis priestleyi]
MPLSAMSLSAGQLSNLQAQHSLQGEDWLSICTLSEVEGIFESAQSWNFEEFLGFTLHLFITTDSPHVRAQVAQKLPKFGSRIVLPLVNILHHFQAIADTQTDARNSALASDVAVLAAQSLSQIAPGFSNAKRVPIAINTSLQKQESPTDQPLMLCR